MHDSFQLLLVGGRRQDLENVRSLLTEGGTGRFQVEQADSLGQALDRLAEKPFDAVLLETALPDGGVVDALSAVRIHAPAVAVLIWATEADEQMAYASVRAGAEDYLVKPRLNGPALARAVQYAIMRHGNKGDRTGEAGGTSIIGLLGAKGGVGTTTIACQLSAELRELTGKPVLLADFDLVGGDVEFLLRACSTHSVSDAAGNVHRLDPDYWRAIIAQTPSGVHALLPPGAGALSDPPLAHRVRHVLRAAKSWYPFIVVDFGTLNGFAAELLADVSRLLIVTTQEVQSLWRAKRVVERLLGLGCTPETTHVLLNRFLIRATIDPRQIERSLGLPIYWMLPNHYAPLARCRENGTLLSGKDGLRQRIVGLAAKLAGIEQVEPEVGLIGRFLARRTNLRLDAGAPPSPLPVGADQPD